MNTLFYALLFAAFVIFIACIVPDEYKSTPRAFSKACAMVRNAARVLLFTVLLLVLAPVVLAAATLAVFACGAAYIVATAIYFIVYRNPYIK